MVMSCVCALFSMSWIIVSSGELVGKDSSSSPSPVQRLSLATDEAGVEGEAAEVPGITSVLGLDSAEDEGLGEVVGELTRQSGLGEALEGVDGPEEVAVEEEEQVALDYPCMVLVSG